MHLHRNFVAGVYLSEAQNPILPPPPYTLYSIRLYSMLIRTGKGGWPGWVGEFNHREGGRGNSSQSCVENTNMTDCISTAPVYTL
jgi:hypothetical protein